MRLAASNETNGGRSLSGGSTRRQARELNALEAGVVTPGRLELPTRSLGNCCSIHLSYGAIFRINNLQMIIKSQVT